MRGVNLKKYIQLNSDSNYETIFDVAVFKERTNKRWPYYQNGRRYAICPKCHSSVQIINGHNNSTKSRDTHLYAAHTKSHIQGLPFNTEGRSSCIYYVGNKFNWQQIYFHEDSTSINKNLKKFLENNILQISTDIGNLIGFHGLRKDGTPSRLIENMIQSFKDNTNLKIPEIQFIPEYLPRMIIERDNPVNCWGAIPTSRTQKILLKHHEFADAFQSNRQFKPHGDSIKIVGVLDNIQYPKKLNIRLLYNQKEIDLFSISCRTNLTK